MGEPTLGYSPVLLKLENQHRVIPIGRIKGVTVDLYGVHTKGDFKVIEIVDGTKPYPTILGLDWEFDNQAIINLKTRKMTFESSEYRFIVGSFLFLLEVAQGMMQFQFQSNQSCTSHRGVEQQNKERN
jgi:hypothetical protein